MTYLPSRPASGEVLMLKTIWMRRLVDLDPRQGPAASRGSLIVSPMVTVVQPDHGGDVAGGGLFDLDAAQLVEQVDLGDLGHGRLGRRPASGRPAGPGGSLPDWIRPMAMRPT